MTRSPDILIYSCLMVLPPISSLHCCLPGYSWASFKNWNVVTSSLSLGWAASGPDSASGSHSTAQCLQPNTDSFFTGFPLPESHEPHLSDISLPWSLETYLLSTHTLLVHAKDMAMYGTETFLPYHSPSLMAFRNIKMLNQLVTKQTTG